MLCPALLRPYTPKHAAPREPLTLETRSALAVGLAAAVLPLGAAPALADGQAASGAAAAPTSTASASPSASASPAAATAAPEAAPAASAASAERPAGGQQPTASATPSSSPSSSPSPYAVGASASPQAGSSSAPAQQQRTKASTALSLQAPAAPRSAKVPVGIRLTSDGRAVRNGFVRIEKSTPQGWSYVGRLLTNAQGQGKGTFSVAGSAKLRAAYTGSRVRTAAVSAARTVRAAQDLGSSVLDEAAKHVGKPYVYGATGPDSFDCSGFTRYVYAKATGKSLPHNSRAQERAATPVSKADARPGDLVFIQDVAGHVGIYAGDGRMYDAPRSGKNVSLRRIWTSNYTVGRV